MLILKCEPGSVPRKKGRGSTLLNRPLGRSLYSYMNYELEADLGSYPYCGSDPWVHAVARPVAVGEFRREWAKKKIEFEPVFDNFTNIRAEIGSLWPIWLK